MREVGKVIKADNGYVTVSIDKKEECSKCGLCAFPKNANTIEFLSKNTVNAQVGDTVVIERKTDGKLGGITLVFLVPLLLIALSTLITYTLIGKEIWILILSAISLTIWYAVLNKIDKKLSKNDKFLANIVEIENQENH